MTPGLRKQIKDRIEWHKTYLAILLADIENPDIHPEQKVMAMQFIPYAKSKIERLQKLLE